MIPVEMFLTTTTNHQPAMIFMDYIFTLEGYVYRNINRSILMLVVLVVGSDVGFRRITEVQFVLQNTGHFASEGIFLWCPQEIVRVAFCIGICSEFDIGKKKSQVLRRTFLTHDMVEKIMICNDEHRQIWVYHFFGTLRHYHGCHWHCTSAIADLTFQLEATASGAVPRGSGATTVYFYTPYTLFKVPVTSKTLLMLRSSNLLVTNPDY